jgi:hypothetical protein
VLFAGLWLTAATMLIKPNSGGLDRAGHRFLGLPRRNATDRSRKAAAHPESVSASAPRRKD